ncbi:MAG: histidine kinase, partial [Flavobacteriaceae bacterium]|nr:histidine kinase [Flavobacteriaceae bacterium]
MRQIILLFFIISNLAFSQNNKEKDFKYTKAIKAANVIYQELEKINSSDSIKNKILEGIRLIDKYETKEAEILYAKLLTELSWCEYQKNDFLKAIEIQLNAQKIFEKHKDFNQLATSNYRLGSYYIKIGSEYNNLGSKDERKTAQQVALGYLKQSVKLAENIKNNEKYLQALGGLANYYVAQKNIDSTIYYSKIMLQKSNPEDYKMKVMANNYLGLMSCEKEDYIAAEKYFKNAIADAEKSNAVSLLSAKGNLAYVYMKQKKYKQAKINVFELIETNKKLKKLHNVGKNYATLYDIYKGENKIDSTLYAYDMYYVYRDSVVDQKHKDLIKELNIKYETEKKEAEITILKQKEKIQSFELEKHKQLLTFSVIGLILIMLTSLIVFFYQKKINTIQNLALRSKLTRSQFNPHYINNAFTSLQATLIEHDLDESLINYTSDISRFSRLLLESTFKDEWTLFEEKQMMEHYLKTQQHRYE